MTLVFRYRRVWTTHPIPTLGGQMFRMRAITNLTVIGPADTVVLPVTLDSGSDDIVLPEIDAMTLGIDLSQAPSGTMGGVGSPPYPVRYAPVRLRLTDGREFRDWPAVVGFTPALANRGLFGQAGGIQYFSTNFRYDVGVAELTVNSLYPGT